MTVLSTRHRGEESRKEYDTFYQLNTPATSVPDLPVALQTKRSSVFVDPDRPRRLARRPSQSSTTRSVHRASIQDQIQEIPRSPRSPHHRSPSASRSGTIRARPTDDGLIPALPRFTHRINLSGRDSALSSPSPLPPDHVCHLPTVSLCKVSHVTADTIRITSSANGSRGRR
jgi:hypothetical protein